MKKSAVIGTNSRIYGSSGSPARIGLDGTGVYKGHYQQWSLHPTEQTACFFLSALQDNLSHPVFVGALSGATTGSLSSVPRQQPPDPLLRGGGNFYTIHVEKVHLSDMTAVYIRL